MFYEVFRDAGAAWCSEGGCAGAGLYEQVVDVAVVAADELYDFIAACGTTCEANCGHNCLGAGTDKADFFNGINGCSYHFCKPGFEFGGYAKAGSLGHYLFDVVKDVSIRVAEYHRPPGETVVDVSFAIGIVDVRAFCLFDEYRACVNSLKCSNGAINATGDDFPGAVEQA